MLYYDPKVNHIDFFRNTQKYTQRTYFPPHQSVEEEKSITICTTCMNRLRDLKQTLIRNIEDNSDYKNLEFLVLDYGSTDGLQDWLAGNKKVRRYIEEGRLNVYRSASQQHFRPNHSRNLSFRLAKNDIIANVDSDNFTHKRYARRINDCASISDEKLLIVPSNFLVKGSSRLKLKGRFALYKKDVERLRGFDEDLDDGFGHDDMNFVFRAMIAGFKIVRYESSFTENRLETTDEERTSLVKNKDHKKMQHVNSKITYRKIVQGKISVNQEGWGEVEEPIVKNFDEEIKV